MSYCRWSTNDFQCDVYVYEDVSGGWTTHVAGMRYVHDEPLPEPIELTGRNAEKWAERYHLVADLISRSEQVPIGLSFDGDTFNDPTAKACAERLQALSDLGYLVPPSVITELLQETP